MSQLPAKAVSLDAPLPGVVGDSSAMRAVYRLTRLVANARASVLLVGETGTGKEVIARNIHRLSSREDGPYVRVNCGALSESLLESELFGHIKGAFTGAVDNKTGRFEAAHGGTIFLDELYYRLNVVSIHLPPLRERRQDIPFLARFFLERYSEENRRDAPHLSDEVMKVLMTYDWPGNVRELENCIERAVVLANGKSLTPDLLASSGQKERRLRLGRMKGGDLLALIQHLVRAGIHS